MKLCGIYKVTNLINGKIYIGQSIDINDRWKQHKTVCFNKNGTNYDYPLYRAFRKYGLENFSFEIIEEIEREKLDEKELFWIEQYNCLLPNGYNQVYPKQGGVKLTPQIVKDIIFELQNNLTDNTETIGEKFNVSGRAIRSINSGKTWFNKDLQYPIRPIGIGEHTNSGYHQKYFCSECNKEIASDSQYCVKCAQIKSRKVERPTKEILLQEIKLKGFSAVGRKYGVSDNAIRKWCKAYSLPTTIKEIKNFEI